jgi:hypothetical protein
MAKQNLEINVNVRTGDASKKVDDLGKGVENIGTNAKKAEAAASSSFRKIGSLLKSLGVITAIVQGFQYFKDVLGRNQKVADAFSTALNFLNVVLSDLVSLIVDNADKVVKFIKDVFQNPQEYVKQLGKLIKENIIERFESIIEAAGLLGQTLKNLFTGNFKEAAESGKKFGKELVDVATGVNNSFDKSAKAINNLSDAAGNYFGNKLEQAKTLTKAIGDQNIAEANLLNAIKQNEIEAEKLRQIRDDDTRSIDERIQANNQLAKVLDEGEKSERALIGQRLNRINKEIKLFGVNNELIAERIRVQGELADVEEKYTGKRSEQLLNVNALSREQQEITKIQIASQNKLAFDQRKAIAENIKDEIERLKVKKQIYIEENLIELKRLEDIVNNHNKGTLAREQAEDDLANKKREVAAQIQQYDSDITQSFLNRNLTNLENLANNQRETFAVRKKALDDEEILLKDAFNKKQISEQDYNMKIKKLSEDRIATEIAEKEHKASIQMAYIDIVGQAAGLAKQLFEKSKGVQIAGLVVEQAGAIGKIIANLGIANAKALSQFPTTAGQPFVGINTASTVLSIASIVANTAKQIQKINNPDSGGASGVSIPNVGGGAPMTPAIPEAQLTQLNQSTINALGNQAVRAYVVETDMTTNQQRIQAIRQRARFR